MENLIKLSQSGDNTRGLKPGARIVYSHCEIKDMDGTWFLDLHNDSTFVLKYQKLSTMTESNWKVTVATGKIENGKVELTKCDGKIPFAALSSIQGILTALLPKEQS